MRLLIVLAALSSAAPAASANGVTIALRGSGSPLDPSGAGSAVGEKNTVTSKEDPSRGSAWYKDMQPGTYHSQSAGFGAQGKSSFTLGVQGKVVTFKASASASSSGDNQGRAVARLIFNLEVKGKGLTKVRLHYKCEGDTSQEGSAISSAHLSVNRDDVCYRTSMGARMPFPMPGGWAKGPEGVVEIEARNGGVSPGLDMEFGTMAGPRAKPESAISSGTITITVEPVF